MDELKPSQTTKFSLLMSCRSFSFILVIAAYGRKWITTTLVFQPAEKGEERKIKKRNSKHTCEFLSSPRTLIVFLVNREVAGRIPDNQVKSFQENTSMDGK
jgi:hypothetical protein